MHAWGNVRVCACACVSCDPLSSLFVSCTKYPCPFLTFSILFFVTPQGHYVGTTDQRTFIHGPAGMLRSPLLSLFPFLSPPAFFFCHLFSCSAYGLSSRSRSLSLLASLAQILKDTSEKMVGTTFSTFNAPCRQVCE